MAAKAIKQKTALEIADFLVDYCFTWVFPEIIQSDQGTEFLNSVVEELMKQFGACHNVSAAYHPQTNGLVERSNQTIKNILSKYSNNKQIIIYKKYRDKFIRSAIWSYNTSCTQESPHFVMRLRFLARQDVYSKTRKIRVHSRALPIAGLLKLVIVSLIFHKKLIIYALLMLSHLCDVLGRKAGRSVMKLKAHLSLNTGRESKRTIAFSVFGWESSRIYTIPFANQFKFNNGRSIGESFKE